jgi:hypothetical protein
MTNRVKLEEKNALRHSINHSKITTHTKALLIIDFFLPQAAFKANQKPP